MKFTAYLAMPMLAVGLLVGSPAHAGLIYQSATPVVASTSDETGANGTSVGFGFFSGVDFQLTSTTRITAIGGHFGLGEMTGNNEIFGAIVAVSSLSAAPADPSLGSGVLATTLITVPPPLSSDTLSGSVDVVLGPGDYAVIFGSDDFGATGAGALIENVTSPGFTGAVNTDGVATYAVRQSDGMVFPQAPGVRIFVEGTASVPEPSSFLMAGLGLATVGLVAACRRP